MRCSAGHPSTEMVPLHGPARRFRPSFSCPVCHRTVDFFGTVIEKGDIEQEEREYDIKTGPVDGDDRSLGGDDETIDPGGFAESVPDCMNGHPQVPMEFVEQPMTCARWFRCPRCSERKLLVSMALLDEASGKNWLWQNQDQNRRLVQQHAMETESRAAASEVRLHRGISGRGSPTAGRNLEAERTEGETPFAHLPASGAFVSPAQVDESVPEPELRVTAADATTDLRSEQTRPVAHRRFLHLLIGSVGLFVLLLLWSLSIHPGGSPLLPAVYGLLFLIGAAAQLWYGREVGDDLSRRQSTWLLGAGLVLAIASWFVPELKVALLGGRAGPVLLDHIPRFVGGVFFLCSGMTGYLARGW